MGRAGGWSGRECGTGDGSDDRGVFTGSWDGDGDRRIVGWREDK